MPSFEFVKWERRGQVTWLTLNRPDKMNAVNPQMRLEILAALDACRGDPETRAVVITGEGRGFCTGADISGRNFPSPIEGDEGNAMHERTSNMRWGWHHIIQMLWECEKPIIAAVNGWAVGFGCQLALYCDLVIASEAARFQEVFSRIGLPLEAGASYVLPRTMSLVQAKEKAFFADPISAEEALQLGMVNRVVPADQLLTLAEEWATRLASGPTRVYGMHKRLLQSSLDGTLQSSMREEVDALSLLTLSTDTREAFAALGEKREPKFTGG